MKNNLFIQRRIQVQKEPNTDLLHFIGSIYIAYYFYVQNSLQVVKYALCIRYTKRESEIKHLLKGK
ncbi:MAG: hypothetical protein ABH952_07180 [Candidatus Omnitrophota bacterium]